MGMFRAGTLEDNSYMMPTTKGAGMKNGIIVGKYCDHSKCKIDENHTFEIGGSRDIKALYALLQAASWGSLRFKDRDELMRVKRHYMSTIEEMIECVEDRNNEE